MEHRSRLHDDGADDEEDDRCEVEDVTPGPQQAHEGEQEQQRAHRRKSVDDLSDALRMDEPEALAELDPDAAHREEAGRGVVAAGGIREAPVRNQPLCVLDRLEGVIAGDRRVDGRVPNGDDRRGRDDAVGDRTPCVPPRTRSPHGASVVPPSARVEWSA